MNEPILFDCCPPSTLVLAIAPEHRVRLATGEYQGKRGIFALSVQHANSCEPIDENMTLVHLRHDNGQ